MTKASTEAAKLANQIAVAQRGLGASRAGAPGATAAVAAKGAKFEPFCGDLDMRIARDGGWHYRGSPIGRIALVKLFASVLRRDAAGDFWLVTPYERARILVDDAPFVAVELEIAGEGRDQRLRFRTNVDETVEAGPDHPIRVVENDVTGEPSPYILVRPGKDGQMGLDALIARPVYYQLADLGLEEDAGAGPAFGVWSGGQFFPLGKLT